MRILGIVNENGIIRAGRIEGNRRCETAAVFHQSANFGIDSRPGRLNMNLHQQFTRQKRTRTGAFTLIETIMAAGIIGIGFISLYAGIGSGFGVIALARENLRATQVMQEKFETLRLYNWDQINSNGFIPRSFTASYYPSTNRNASVGITYNGTMVITNFPTSESYATNMRLVILTVNWTSGQIQRTRQMQTAVARYGLQNYIY